MANVFIVHGIYGNPKENWFPWLKKELTKLGHKVIVPQFPTPKDHSLKGWTETLHKYKKFLTNNCVLIGHSLGGAFLLNILQGQKTSKAIFVASVPGKIENKFDSMMKDITHRKFDFKKIQENCKKIHLIASDNDEYIPLKESERLAKKLHTKVTLVKNAGHFNERAGYKKFELLLKYFKNVKQPKKGSRKTKKS